MMKLSTFGETGVNSDVGKLYLAHEVLSIVIQVGHETRRFNYDEIKQIYEMSVKRRQNSSSIFK